MNSCGMCQKPEGNPDCVFCKEKTPSVIVKYSELQNRSYNGKRGISFLPNNEAPFSGRAEDSFPNGQKRCDYKIKEGVIIEGKEWYQNGQLKWEKSSTKSIMFFEDGVKREVKTYTNGLLSDCSAWKENRQKCPYTKLENGNGVLVWWEKNMDGYDRPDHAFAFKDGREIDTWGLPWGSRGNFYSWLNKINAPLEKPSFLEKYRPIVQIFYGLVIPVVLYDLIGVELDFLKFKDFSLPQYLYCALLIGLSWIASRLLTSESFYRKEIFEGYSSNEVQKLIGLISCARGWVIIILLIVAYKYLPF